MSSKTGGNSTFIFRYLSVYYKLGIVVLACMLVYRHGLMSFSLKSMLLVVKKSSFLSMVSSDTS